MKFTKPTLNLLFLVFTTHFNAQNCENALLLKEGNALTYNTYNKKGKAIYQTTVTTTFLDTENDWSQATVNSTVISTSNEDSFDTTYKISCENGMMSYEMIHFFETAILSKYNALDFVFEMDGDILEFPSQLEVGQDLNGGTFTAAVEGQTKTLIKIIFEISQRKVVDNEMKTTNMGTFECKKITYNYSNQAGIKTEGTVSEWYTNDKLLLRAEKYNRKGKIIAIKELVNITKK